MANATKRDFLKTGGGALMGVGLAACGGSQADEASKLPFVLVHGAWHGGWCWERVTPLLAARGHAAVARDLPAHGLQARFPAAYASRPLNAAAFATEPSPVADTTLDDYVDRVISTIDQVRALGHEKVVLVAHSMGGVVASAVAQRAPQKLAKLVYLTAFMPSSGMPGIAYIPSPENAGERVGPMLLANPEAIGALRIDPRSTDAAYRANVKLAFFQDLNAADFDAVSNLLTTDVPVAPFATPIALTPSSWGSMPRHYIKCSQDMAIRPALQKRFIDEADAFVPDNRTQVHQLDSSHSPFLSQPALLADMLVQIASS